MAMSAGPSERPRIAVVGSFNVDMVARVPRRPQKGETLIGTQFTMVCGGKGSNQAIAAARSGADVWMIGRLGQDVFGDQCIGVLQAEGIQTEMVVRDPAAGTGIASILLDDEGDNSIVIIPRANMLLTSDDVHAARD